MTSALMTVQAAIAVTPPTSRALASGVTQAVWYPLHEAAGAASVTDKLGNGEALALTGTEGTLWTANWGGATPDGATHRLSSAAAPAYLQALGRLDTIDGQELLIGYEIAHDGDLAATPETLMCWGRFANIATGKGGWRVVFNSAEQTEWQTHGGEGASNQVSSAIPSSGNTGVTARVQVVLSVTGIGSSTVQVTRHSYRVGTGLQTVGSVNHVMLPALGGMVPQPDTSGRFNIFARQAGAASWDQFMGATAGSNAKVNNVWLARLSAYNLNNAYAALQAMIAAPRSFPLSLLA